MVAHENTEGAGPRRLRAQLRGDEKNGLALVPLSLQASGLSPLGLPTLPSALGG